MCSLWGPEELNTPRRPTLCLQTVYVPTVGMYLAWLRGVSDKQLLHELSAHIC